MEVVATAIIVFFATFSVTEKYLEPWVNDKVEQYYEAKEQHMAWVLVALFIFDGEPMIMSDNILYESRDLCAIDSTRGIEVCLQLLQQTWITIIG